MMAYDLLFKYNIFVKNASHPIYDIMDYFHIPITKTNVICPVCLNDGNQKLEKLKCEHSFCIDCILGIQKDNRIKCPLCRIVHDYAENPYRMTLIIDGKDVRVDANMTCKQLVTYWQKERGWKYIWLSHDYKILESDVLLKDMGIRNGSLITCYVRMPHQLTPAELAEWRTSKNVLVFAPDM